MPDLRSGPLKGRVKVILLKAREVRNDSKWEKITQKISSYHKSHQIVHDALFN